MAKLRIQGGTSLNGEISVSGAKNAALKMMAAALLTEKQVILKNVPDIVDIHTMKDIMVKLGAKIAYADHIMTINCSAVSQPTPDVQLVKHLRGSVVIIGPLLARFGKVMIPQPGGCLIGSRSIDTHVTGLQQLGISVVMDEDIYEFSADSMAGGRVVLSEMSVTATENVLMAATMAKGTTEIRLAAAEPEIEDLAMMLNDMGARIKGAGTSVITVEGVTTLNGVEHTVIPDRIEAGTFAIAAAVSRGDVRIMDVDTNHMDIVLRKLSEANVNYEVEGTSVLHVKPTTIFNAVSFDTRPYPGFPTDLQAPFSVLMTQANGTSKIFETLFDGRLSYTKELKKMGADISLSDSHTAIIQGPTPLYGKHITSFDLRAGATLLIAAIIAQGESIIDKSELIDRGYEKLDERFSKLGATMTREK